MCNAEVKILRCFRIVDRAGAKRLRRLRLLPREIKLSPERIERMFNEVYAMDVERRVMTIFSVVEFERRGSIRNPARGLEMMPDHRFDETIPEPGGLTSVKRRTNMSVCLLCGQKVDDWDYHAENDKECRLITARICLSVIEEKKLCPWCGSKRLKMGLLPLNSCRNPKEHHAKAKECRRIIVEAEQKEKAVASEDGKLIRDPDSILQAMGNGVASER